MTEKIALELAVGKEHFFANFKFLKEPGFLEVLEVKRDKKEEKPEKDQDEGEEENAGAFSLADRLKKGDRLTPERYEIKEGETTPPKRYTSGSLILAMENAGQLIEDESLREQIRGSGIGTSATRAEILKKLTSIQYLQIYPKSQIVVPKVKGELIYDTVALSVRQLLNPELTASWEKGLSYVAEGSVSADEYMEKLTDFVRNRTEGVKRVTSPEAILPVYQRVIREIEAAKDKKA